MPVPRPLARARGRAALLWCLAVFAAGQVALNAWVRRAHPEVCDPTWNFRLQRLRARLAEAPGRPLVVFVGSSRAANGFSPADLRDWRPRGRPAPVVFNFATLGGGPVRELLTLRRLLARGIRPDFLVAEVWPAFWLERGIYEEERPVRQCDSQLSDVPVLARVYRAGWETVRKTCEAGLFPFLHGRAELLFNWAPLLAPRGAEKEIRWGKAHWITLDEHGWLPILWAPLESAEFAFRLEEARAVTKPILDEFEVLPGADWEVRELARECRAHGVRLAFVYMPEHSGLRGWYTDRTLSRIGAYLGQISEEYGVPVIDARTWVGDDGFHDFSHMQVKGARAFSAIVGREILRPLLEGRPLPPAVLLRPGAGPSAPPARRPHARGEGSPENQGPCES
jgi:hypothetical protein